MTCEQMSCEFDSSGGAFPNGYCLWEEVSPNYYVPISCHCKEGYCCGDGPAGKRQPSKQPSKQSSYRGKIVKWQCDPKATHLHQQRQQ
jgi:hypothetical protein